MFRIICISDTHYGLKSAGYDRTEEIHSITSDVCEYAIHNSADLFVHLGDLGHRANPDSRIHALWVQLFEKLDRAGVGSYFMLGNHDIVNDKYRPDGSLAPLKKLNYKNIEAVILPRGLYVSSMPYHLFFLPYFSRAAIKEDHNQFYEKWVAERLSDYKDYKFIAFTHLNIENADYGNDQIIRPVNAVVPKQLYDDDRVELIVSGHIHKPQRVGKQIVVGSPICTDFGDTDPKGFVQIDIMENDIEVKLIPTNHIKLKEIELDFVDKEIELPSVDSLGIENCGVKIRLRLTQDQINRIDLQKYYEDLSRKAKFVRPIIPTVVKRDMKTKTVLQSGMTDAELVAAFINSKKPTNKKHIIETANEILEVA